MWYVTTKQETGKKGYPQLSMHLINFGNVRGW